MYVDLYTYLILNILYRLTRDIYINCHYIRITPFYKTSKKIIRTHFMHISVYYNYRGLVPEPNLSFQIMDAIFRY